MEITYFVHGTTTDNELDLATGWEHGELSELGIRQSKELGELFENGHFDVVFCSDLKRAIDSAQLAFGGKAKILQDSRLREANYGDLTQKPSEKFKSHLARYVNKPFPNGESYSDVEKRMADFLDFLKEFYKEKIIGIVAHQGPQLALEVITKGKTWEQAIAEDWRHTKAWEPGWKYPIK